MFCTFSAFRRLSRIPRDFCRVESEYGIRKTANLLFLLEKAGIGGSKHEMYTTVEQGLFSKSIETRILCEMLSLLGQAGESTRKHR